MIATETVGDLLLSQACAETSNLEDVSHTGRNMLLRHIPCQLYAPAALLPPGSSQDHAAMDMRRALGKVIRNHRKAMGQTQIQVADATGIDQAAISRIEGGKMEADRDQLQRLADHYGCRVSTLWMEAEGIAEFSTAEGVAPALPGIRYVPLISWVQAGNWQEAVDAYARGQGAELVHTSAKVSPCAYALRVKGDSMTNPKGYPTFPEGTRIIVDPKRPVENMDLVVIRLEQENETTFKRYVREAGRISLVPLNPQYPTLSVDSPAIVCGVVVATAEQSL